ncbi:MAG TPA: tRNA (adenosine(37)-N6)-dimethylallyltransferase MiaA, partial [Candidatus Avibacteroides faecavium]|nr:tRNA (adenosine(37)-N6)-dimethylallyltransferase MiaA [Candidatus Avibacteroides faecavium]
MTGGRLITIIGPTASGKTALAAALADRLGAEIISADSRQVYRGMDIGTGKDLDEYVIGGRRVPCHLIDVRDAGYHYNLFEYQEDFLRTYRDLMARGKDAVLCGGSGLYVESVLKGYAMMPVPEDKALRSRLEGKTLDELTAILATYKRLHNTTDTDTPKRAIRAIEIEEYYRANNITARQFPSIDSIVFGIQVDRETRRQRISRRLDARLDGGLVDEVRRLLD